MHSLVITMPKKTAQKNTTPKKPSGTETPKKGGTRRGTVTVETLRKALPELEQLIGDFQTVAENMENAQITSVRIDGFAQLTRGLETLSKFIGHVDRSYKTKQSKEKAKSFTEEIRSDEDDT